MRSMPRFRSFLTDLVIVSILLGIFHYLTFVLKGIKKSFLFSSIKWWTSLPLEIRTSSSSGFDQIQQFYGRNTHQSMKFFFAKKIEGLGARSFKVLAVSNP